MDHSDLNVCSFVENYIGLKKVIIWYIISCPNFNLKFFVKTKYGKTPIFRTAIIQNTPLFELNFRHIEFSMPIQAYVLGA